MSDEEPGELRGDGGGDPINIPSGGSAAGGGVRSVRSGDSKGSPRSGDSNGSAKSGEPLNGGSARSVDSLGVGSARSGEGLGGSPNSGDSSARSSVARNVSLSSNRRTSGVACATNDLDICEKNNKNSINL